MKVIMRLALIALALNLTACGFEIVDTGRRGLEVHFGKVEGDPLPEGLHFYNPFSADIIEVDVREQKLEADTDAFTKDTQNVKISYALTYYPDPTKIKELYVQFGSDWSDKIINQVILGSMKDAIGQFNADDLVSKREIAKQAAQKEITDALLSRGVIVTRLDFTNLDFDDAYEKAVEQKVVAIQEAQRAKNETVKIEEQARQTVATAKATAEAMRIQTDALRQSKALVEMEAVKKWDGVLPQFVIGGGSIPFIDIGKMAKSGSSRTE